MTLGAAGRSQDAIARGQAAVALDPSLPVSSMLLSAVYLYAVKPDSAPRVIHHSDQGCHYTGVQFGKRCQEVGVRPSMGSVGDAYE